MAERKKEYSLAEVVDLLILNGTLLQSPGLLHGRMGIAVFFFHYYQYTSDSFFEEYAMELLHSIRAEIHHDSPADYATGLAGIGVGVEYLTQQCFLDIDTDFVLEELDRRMQYEILYRVPDNFSLANGLTGLAAYFLWRTNRNSDSKQYKTNLKMLNTAVQQLEAAANCNDRNKQDIENFLYGRHSEYTDMLIQPVFEKGKLSLSGYAGWGLKQLTQDDKIPDTWLKLYGKLNYTASNGKD